MGFFIFWVVLILAAVLSVPIVSFLEKRKNGPAAPAFEEPDDEGAEEEVVLESDGEVAFEAADEMPAGGDDFAEFEEVR